MPARQSAEKIILSASRRTDIPAFYMEWFNNCIRQGEFEVENPYNRRVFKVPALPQEVHSIVFWTKNPLGFLKDRQGEQLEKMGYRLFFHYTVNSGSRVLEPRVPPLSQRLAAMKQLAKRFTPKAVTWRFDPICHFVHKGRNKDNLKDFLSIADAAANCGIRRCKVSFVDLYPKIKKRLAGNRDFSFAPPAAGEKAALLEYMAQELGPRGIALDTCCEKEVLRRMPGNCTVKQGACIDHHLLESLFGPGLSHKKDPGQRRDKGCGCHVSRDVGSYSRHPCFHNCLFCYANPASIMP